MTNSFKFLLLCIVMATTLIVDMGSNSGAGEAIGEGIAYKIEHQILTTRIIQQARNLKQIDCLARNVYYESRGESWDGQLAVAMVTLNRVNDDRFPNSICGVVNERYQVNNQLVCQFSWRCEIWNNHNLKIKSDHISYKIAEHAIMNYDSLTVVTHDTLWFHANYVKPKWRKQKQRVAQIDAHIFYRLPN